ncbi:MAG: YidC/Oxa1 family membrane protein insertase [bacterium]
MMKHISCIAYSLIIIGSLLLIPVAHSDFDTAWLMGSAIKNEDITAGLNAISVMSQSELAQLLTNLEENKESATDKGKQTAALLTGFALEMTNQIDLALAEYRQLSESAPDTDFAVSAKFRQSFLEIQAGNYKKKNALYESSIADSDQKGWFRYDTKENKSPRNEWTYESSITFKRQSQVYLRSDFLSFRLFAFLRSYSIFPTNYAYLFVLIVLAIGVKILEFPLYYYSAKSRLQIKRLDPLVQMIKENHSDDSYTAAMKTQALYKMLGVKWQSGCLTLLVELIFFVWMLLTMRIFSPQMALDGSTFLWCADVLKFDLGIVIVSLVVKILISFITQTSDADKAQIIMGSMFMSGLLILISRYWRWPAYAFIFLMILDVIGIVIKKILDVIVS